MREHTIECGARAVIMDQVVGEFGKLIDDDITLGVRKLGPFVVVFFALSFRSRRGDDVAGACPHTPQPTEALSAHAGGQPGDAAAVEDAQNSNPATAVVS